MNCINWQSHKRSARGIIKAISFPVIVFLISIALFLTRCTKKPGIILGGYNEINIKKLEYLPKPTTFYELPFESLKINKKRVCLLDIKNKIQLSLNCGRYDDICYYETEGDGFIMVTRPEKIKDDRSSLEGNRRWDKSINLTFRELFSFRTLKMIFVGKYGIFRMFAFIVTKNQIPMAQLKTPEDEENTYNLFERGSPKLSNRLEETEYSKKHYITVFIYEFGKYEDKDDLSFNLEGQISGKKHLEKAKIIECLRSSNENVNG